MRSVDVDLNAPERVPHLVPPRIEIRFMVPDDQVGLLPRRRRAPVTLPAEAPLPRAGEIVYLSSSSAWTVQLVVHEWRSPSDLVIEVWIAHLGPARVHRPTGFELTQ